MANLRSIITEPLSLMVEEDPVREMRIEDVVVLFYLYSILIGVALLAFLTELAMRRLARVWLIHKMVHRIVRGVLSMVQ